jgi:hypothetical protein
MSDRKTHRDTNGRFAVGNSGGPGRPRRAVEANYLAALSEAVSVRKWKKIVEKAVKDALAGDRHAREWIGDYVLGKPDHEKLLELAAKEMVGFDSVGARASAIAITKPMVDARVRHFLTENGDRSPGPT